MRVTEEEQRINWKLRFIQKSFSYIITYFFSLCDQINFFSQQEVQMLVLILVILSLLLLVF